MAPIQAQKQRFSGNAGESPAINLPPDALTAMAIWSFDATGACPPAQTIRSAPQAISLRIAAAIAAASSQTQLLADNRTAERHEFLLNNRNIPFHEPAVHACGAGDDQPDPELPERQHVHDRPVFMA